MRLYEFKPGVTTLRKVPDVRIAAKSVNEFLSEKCPIAFNSPMNIFRGTMQPSLRTLMYADSSKNTRVSANTNNWYTLLMDNILSEWQVFPKRSKSFICSTTVYGAKQFSKFDGKSIFRVYPLGDPIIGVCPSGDLWDSFQNIHLPNFSRMFRDLADLCNTSSNDTLENLVQIISILDKNWDIGMARLPKWSDGTNPTYANRAYNILDRSVDFTDRFDSFDKFRARFSSFSQFLTWLINPNRNQFIFKKLSEFGLEYNNQSREVWFSGPAHFRMV